MSQATYLVATDLSRASHDAAAMAASIASHTGADLELYCAIPQPERGVTAATHDAVREELRSLAKKLGRGGVTTSSRSRIVPAVAKAVSRRASRHAADLVVVGPRGAGDWRSPTLGSVAESVLRAPLERVLVGRRSSGSLDRILVAVDRGTGSSGALREALRLAQALDARVLVLEVLTSGAEALALDDGVGSAAREPAHAAYLERLRAWVDAYPVEGVSLTCEATWGSPARVICERAQDWGAGLIAVGAVGTASGRAGRLGRITRQVAGSASTSTLVVRDRPPRRAVRSTTEEPRSRVKRLPRKPRKPRAVGGGAARGVSGAARRPRPGA